jgi:4-hydroxy-3-polyprenylbenzoate decarboxylase
MKRLIIGISGASGVIYGIRMLEQLKTIDNVETHLVMSNYSKMNVGIETTHTVNYVESLADVVHNIKNQAASISSGSFKTDGMVVAPCSMQTLSARATFRGLRRSVTLNCRRSAIISISSMIY